MSALPCLGMMFWLRLVVIYLENFLFLLVMLSCCGRILGTFKSLGGNRFGISSLGQSANFSCGWWFMISVLPGIIYVSVVFRAPRCVCYVVIVKRVFLIAFFNVPSLGIFGIYGGSRGTNLVGMPLLWLHFLLDGARPLS